MDVMSKIEYFIEYKGLTKYAVEKKLGWSKNSISSSGAMKSDRLVKLIHLFDDLSLDWLLRDEGPMLRQKGTTENETDASNQLYIDGVPDYNPEFNYTEDDVKKLDKKYQDILCNTVEVFSDKIEYYKKIIAKQEAELRLYRADASEKNTISEI